MPQLTLEDATEICNNSGYSRSLWMDIPLPTFPPLKSDLHTDVVIIGAGIVGLTSAYILARQGKSVVVLDQGAIAGGQTARTTGHLTWALDKRYYELEETFGKETAQLIAKSHSDAIDEIESIINKEKIDCDFERVDGYLFPSDEKGIEVINKEAAAIEKLGFKIEKLENAPLKTAKEGPFIKFPRQAQFHVLKYFQGLIKSILKHGGKIYSQTHVNHIEDGSPCIVKTSAGAKVTAKSIIVATCTPVNNRVFIHTKQYPYRTYAIAASVPKGSIAKGLFWDTEDPYHYVRLQYDHENPKKEWLIVGGEDHKTGQDQNIEEKYDHLEKWAKKNFPMINKIEYKWSGQVFEPDDSIGFIGRNPGDENTYIATGTSGNGITYGTISGMLISDLILGKENPLKEVYEPSRKTLSAAPEYLEENLNTLIQLKDWFTPGEATEIDELETEEGIILRQGLKKIAVYKDKQNKIHVHSALCPHLGGCVRWNKGEKSWDCPLHGSRFDGCGKVITGPSISNLYPDSIDTSK